MGILLSSDGGEVIERLVDHQFNPSLIKMGGLPRILAIAKGYSHDLILDEEGRIWTRGCGTTGQLGFEDCNSSHSFRRVDRFSTGDYSPIVALGAGHDSSVVLDENGQLWSCGDLCCEFTIGCATEVSYVFIPIPYPEPRLHIITVAVGYYHFLAIDRNGQLWGGGEPECFSYGYGEDDDPYATDSHLVPIAFPSPCRPVLVAAGHGHSLVIDENGQLWGCGSNYSHQLGLSLSRADRCNSFEKIGKKIPSRAKAVAAGRDCSVILDEDGLVWVCGSNRSGELGIPHREEIKRFTSVPNLPKMKAIRIPSGEDITQLIDEDGQLWTSGDVSLHHPEKLHTFQRVDFGCRVHFDDSVPLIRKRIKSAAS